ncbi:hypothetical protein RvY_15570 [Ramazzottius varieornatus]|uniref:Uncharacterized protein n=1 Tax=Ramazzottius varieornatus TaxID=947166 RepID=A0A1D1VVE0_RAMVA|nr:hypothetical protein RvY_15570 [Ramazzottius varieornatus]
MSGVSQKKAYILRGKKKAHACPRKFISAPSHPAIEYPREHAQNIDHIPGSDAKGDSYA